MTIEANGHPHFVIAADMAEGISLPFLSGEVVIFSSKSPVRETANEDAAAVIPYDEGAGIFVVADGLGGHPDGNAASRVAVKTMARVLERGASEKHEIRTAILDGMEAANRAVCAFGSGAGTTLSIAEFRRNEIRPYHVGDSMILVVGQRGRMKLQTISHSPTGYAVEAGLLDEAEALVHEDRHVVSNMVGSDEMRIEVGMPVEFAEHDTLLVASDGLADNLTTQEIVEFIRKGPLATAGSNIANLARERMQRPMGEMPSKPDDLTFLLFRRS